MSLFQEVRIHGGEILSIPTLPYSIRRFLNDGGDIAGLCDEALNELGRMVIVDRHLGDGFVDWDRRTVAAFGALEECDWPAHLFRRWDSEIANNDGDLADRIENMLPYVVTEHWSRALENERRCQ